jgi:hypothetical protein
MISAEFSGPQSAGVSNSGSKPAASRISCPGFEALGCTAGEDTMGRPGRPGVAQHARRNAQCVRGGKANYLQWGLSEVFDIFADCEIQIHT